MTGDVRILRIEPHPEHPRAARRASPAQVVWLRRWQRGAARLGVVAWLAGAGLLAVCVDAPAVNRCTDANGKVTITDRPCQSGEQRARVVVKPSSSGFRPEQAPLQLEPPEQPLQPAPTAPAPRAQPIAPPAPTADRKAHWLAKMDGATVFRCTERHCVTSAGRYGASPPFWVYGPSGVRCRIDQDTLRCE